MIMEEKCDKPTRQVDIVKEIQRLTGYSYESCRCNSFRNPNAIPELWKKYKKVMLNNYTCYIKGKGEYKQNFKKPDEYFEFLETLNTSDKIYTLGGTQSHCLDVLDKDKTINIDHSPHSQGLKKDIYTIKEEASYNLDYEGILTYKKIKHINETPWEYIVLTFRSSKRNFLLEKIKGRVLKRHSYRSPRGVLMMVYLFSKSHNLVGDSWKI